MQLPSGLIPHRAQLHLLQAPQRPPLVLVHGLPPIHRVHERDLLVGPCLAPGIDLLLLPEGRAQRAGDDEQAPRNAPPAGRGVPEDLVAREREQHLRVDHLCGAGALLVRQAGGEEELHHEAAHAEGDEEAPLAHGGGEAEVDAGDEERDGADERAPRREVVDGDEGVGALPDPADRGVGAGGTGGAQETDGDGYKSLGRGGFVDAVRTGDGGCGVGDGTGYAVGSDNSGCGAVTGEEGGGLCDHHHACK